VALAAGRSMAEELEIWGLAVKNGEYTLSR
jgi:hypothetical protein